MNQNLLDIKNQVERLKNLPETPSRRAKIKGLEKVLEKGFPTKSFVRRKRNAIKREDITITVPIEKKKMTMEEMRNFLNLNA